MSDFEEYKQNQEKSNLFNREPGVTVVPGSPFANEMAKFEQFPSRWTFGTNPGRPYVKREFPKMVYKAERVNGTPACMAAPPDPINYKDPRELERAEAAAIRFTEKCQKIVNDEAELQKAMEAGWRQGPQEAIDFLIERDRAFSKEEAHRAHDDRNMSDAAKREIREAKDAVGGDPLPEIVEKRRGRPRKAAGAA